MGEIHFLLADLIFIFFFVLSVGWGAPLILKDVGVAQNITAPTCGRDLTLSGTVLGQTLSVTIPFLGFIECFWGALTTFFTVMAVSTEITWLSLLVLTPALIVLIYLVARLVRGGG